ncbi:SDR family oxidoreductase [Fibrella aquatilis]|uniref:SDR family NAD(P)-dependent oxidoreductase n=1 Tax=Fibrella aquatilis TaxID=2817059 RepID=A0A939G8C5_9BACT|nr:SDR family NAD(P)-dependent oxidoreductase [Fibrella aquatilis]MBO0931941.1 SDR family NAD(P)-dependent oxidoreductase [Fibrella aquatilis]
MQLSNNTIFITGGSVGIGLALAESFLNAGNTVIVCGRRADKLAEAKARFPQLHTIVADLVQPAERERLLETLQRDFPGLNVLVNNAGIQRFVDLTNGDGAFSAGLSEIETNLIAPFHLVTLFAPLLQTQPSAAIINITSGLGFTPLAIFPVYCATKAAMHAFSLSLRYQLRATSVRVFEIIPPIVNTELKGDATPDPRGIPASVVADETMKAIALDTYEVAIGMADMLRGKREAAFGMINPD